MENKGRILVVDDDVDICETLKDILEIEDYNVSVAHSGSEALGVFDADAFDVVLMDVKMPGLNGVETFKKMKVKAPCVRVIMITAVALGEQIEEAMQAGAVAALRKPFEFDQLFAAIDSAQKEKHA